MRLVIPVIATFLFSLSISAQIELVKDINPEGSGISSAQLVIFNNELYFTGRLGISDRELYKSDGTAAGTYIVKDIYADGGSSPRLLTPAGDYLYFEAFDSPTNRELYRTDGTEQGTVLVADIAAGTRDPNIQNLTAVGNKLFFTASDFVNGNELYVVEGEGIPLRLTDFGAGSSGVNFKDMVAFNGLLFFSTESDADGLGFELYVSDGTVEGTQLFKDLNPGPAESGPDHFAVIGDKLFFSAKDSVGEEPWISDGTPEGTYRIADVFAGSDDSNPLFFTGSHPGKVFFAATGEGIGQELYITDGTEAGTRLVKDIRSGVNSASSPDDFTQADGNLYFSAREDNTGRELYFSDGTTDGTYLVADLNPGPDDADFFGDCFAWYDSTLFFGGDNGATGRELWVVVKDTLLDYPVQDLNPGSADANPDEFVIYKDSLFFFASGIEGEELRKMGPYNPCDYVVCPLGQVCQDGTCVEPDDPGPVDPCADVNCPLGQVCYDGSCYPPIDGYTVLILTPSGDPIVGAKAENPSNGITVFSDTTGRVYVDDNTWEAMIISKDGYSTVYQELGGKRSHYVFMQYDACSDVDCPEGMVCRGGDCYSPGDTVFTTISANARADGAVLENIMVTELGTSNSFMLDGPTEISLVTDKPHLIFSDTTSEYMTEILPFVAGQQAYYMKKQAGCEDIVCPLGEICYDGVCYNPDELYEYSGYIMGSDSLPLANVTVTTTFNYDVNSDQNGYFRIRFPIQSDSLLLRFNKTNYLGMGQYIYANRDNFVQMTGIDLCEGTTCPEGQVCYAGSCYPASFDPGNLCEDVVCPLGQVCYEGSCYEPCLLDSTLCYNPANPCEDVQCPLGLVCYEGSCYDPCYLDQSIAGLDCSGYNDPCDGITVQPGYICQDGVLIPECPENVLACAVSDPCATVNCLPGEACFQCFDDTGYNTSGTAIIRGVLSQGLLKSGETAQMQYQNVYIYLRDAETGRNVAIARTDDEGQFRFDSLPAADYLLFAVTPGYFISEEEQLISVAEGAELKLDIISQDAFLKLELTPLTAAEAALSGNYPTWYPSPGDGTRFFLDETGGLDFAVLYDISGKRIETMLLGAGGSTLELRTHRQLTPGFYIIRWKNANDRFPKAQTLLVQ